MVEHTLGKGEVESSILSCSTIYPLDYNNNSQTNSLHFTPICVTRVSIHLLTFPPESVRRRMIWNIRGDFGAEVIGSSGLGYAALR